MHDFHSKSKCFPLDPMRLFSTSGKLSTLLANQAKENRKIIIRKDCLLRKSWRTCTSRLVVYHMNELKSKIKRYIALNSGSLVHCVRPLYEYDTSRYNLLGWGNVANYLNHNLVHHPIFSCIGFSLNYS